jgi:hypothetical protein
MPILSWERMPMAMLVALRINVLSLLALSLILATATTACSAYSISLSDEEQTEADIYTAVIKELVHEPLSQVPSYYFTIYLVEVTDDRGDSPFAPISFAPIRESVQKAISAKLDRLPADFVWIHGFSDVERDSFTGAIEGNGAIVTLWKIGFMADGSAQVPGSIYFGNLGASGTRYVVEQIGGVWQVTGNTGWAWQA